MAQEISIRQSLSRSYKNTKVQQHRLELFKKALQAFLLERDTVSQDEEYNKKLIDKFLSAAFYSGTNAINTNNPTDLVIFADAQAKGSHPVVLFEVKMPDNDEMVRRDDLNRKALHELVLYYIREEEQQHNTDIKHLVVTDGMQWFFFDKQVFYDCFVARKTFCKKVLTADHENSKTQYIFQKIIAPHVAALGDELKYCYLNLGDAARQLDKKEATRSRALEDAYKLLSPPFLLKQAMMIDHNELNEEFYLELLYIMGLEEVMQDGVAKIVRCAEGRRHRHSLIEETIFALDMRSDISNDEECEDIALGLVLAWVNRLLFLKLLEAQLLEFNGEEGRKFLTPDRIPDFATLNDLFLYVLSQPLDERSDDIAQDFEDIPYLNSSLFEYSPLELRYGTVKQLFNGRIEVFRRTRIHDEQRRLLRGEKPVLEYLLRFLDAYDFSGSPKEKQDDDEQKTIINAAVLGIIFEKINGYKDGAFFTPSYLSEYICRETIRRTVVERFNDHYGWTCDSFEELANSIKSFDPKAIAERNTIINSLRICDPSVGSGHFLVSALNELLLIKFELSCLCYYDSTKLINTCEVGIEESELVINYYEGGVFKYDKNHYERSLIQKSLFEEKRTLIENCLFGVDLNPKSVEICRLRLWIELLKNAYYEKGVLQTLPNIDSNIKCGNSLISKYPVHVGRSVIDSERLNDLERYRQLNEAYKNCDEKRRKWGMMREMDQLLRSTMVLDQQQRSLFNVSEAVVTSAMDWMTQFPELLDDSGRFQGFDIVIGNPPYINMQSLPDMTEVYERLKQPTGIDSHEVKALYETYSPTGDICSLFFERGRQLLKPGGRLCFVTTSKWLRTGWGENTRRFLTEQTNPQLLVDFPKQKLFKKATVEVCVLMFTRGENRHRMQACPVRTKEDHLADYVNANMMPCDFNGGESWVIRSEANKEILAKVKACSKPLGEWDHQIYRGILTGRNDVFIISGNQRQQILAACATDDERQRTDELLRPVLKGRDLRRYAINFADRWLIHTHNGIAEQNIPAVDIDEYPALKAYLDEHYDQINKRGDRGQTPYNLRNCVYWPEFSKPKIVWGDIADVPKFALDEKGSYFSENTTYWMTGSHLVYLLVYLNSPLSAYLFSKVGNTTGAGSVRWQKYKVEQQLVPVLTAEDESHVGVLYHQYVATQDQRCLDEAYDIINRCVGLTPLEVDVINRQSGESNNN